MRTLCYVKTRWSTARSFIAAIAITASIAACVSLAPGADKVRLTKSAADVANCTAAGNIRVPYTADGQIDVANANDEFRNQVVGLGGNTAYVTSAPLGVPIEGVAYRCP
jgi:hypothetical protein